MEKQIKLAVMAHIDGAWVGCGVLTHTEEGNQTIGSSFAYGSRYIKRPNALEVDPTTAAFANLPHAGNKMLFPSVGLPFIGGIRDAAPDAWGRRVIEAKLKVAPDSLPESQYLLHAGSDRVGALGIRASLTSPPINGAQGVNSLAYLMDAAQRIDEGQDVPAHLTPIFAAGSGLGGARPKATVRDECGILYMAKFSRKGEKLNMPWLEMATLRLAQKTGSVVPQVEVRRIGERDVMLIQRFDRYWTAQGAAALSAGQETLDAKVAHKGYVEKRLGFVSGLTLMQCHEMDSPSKSYADLALAIQKYGHPGTVAADKRELFCRMVFNIFVTNNDDHLRNHGMVFDPKLRGWRLSPLYDVTPGNDRSSERVLHLSVGPQGKLATLDNALAGCASFGLSPQGAQIVMSQVWEKVREWQVYFQEWGVPAEQVQAAAGAFRHVRDVASPALQAQLP